MDELFAALHSLEQVRNNWEMDRALASRVLIVVEELFSNTIEYGYGEPCAKPVQLHPLSSLAITYFDDAPPFEPTHWKVPDNHMLPLDKHPDGEAGIAMAMGFCAHVTYKPRIGGNLVVLTF